MDGLVSQETTFREKASTGSRGITPLPPGAPKVLIQSIKHCCGQRFDVILLVLEPAGESAYLLCTL
jgi:hypothetical protein